MEAKVLFVCLFVCVHINDVVGQVGSLCRPNERLLSCGCPKTCKDPAPNCEGVCKEGCFCEEGQVRNDEGLCVKLADCPPLSSSYRQDTSEPRINGGLCSEDEVYRYCEPCNRTCDTPNPVCPAQCARGCFCKGDLLRDRDGRCVQWAQCSNIQAQIEERERSKFQPMPSRYSCGVNQVYKKCEKCTRYCGDLICGSKCKTGCFCKDGYVKGPDGLCMKETECTQNV